MKKFLLIIQLISINLLFAQVPVPETGCYHAAFTGNNTNAEFTALAQKGIAIEMFFTGWPANKIADFPFSKCTQIVNNGAIPHITWMFQVSGSPYPLDAIINGSWDSFIRNYANQTKTFDKPIFIRLGHEFNGDWYTYGGINNGGGKLDGFGDNNVADGPERFIAAYKRVHDIFEEQGADKVVWVWCPNNGGVPNEEWNDPVNYYPGDDYVDWIGMDGYNFGTSQSWSGWAEFVNIYMELYQKFVNYNKPMMIAEYATVEQGGNKAEWIRKAYSIYLKYSFTQVKAVTWFHIRKSEGGVDTDWRINSSPESLEAYQKAIADPYYLSSIITDVEEQSGTMPDKFELANAYPNPFNPATVIEYTIPAEILDHSNSILVKLVVYDSLGREVEVLTDKLQTAGHYSVTFDSENLTSGYHSSSGVYYYKLTAGGYSITKKFILVK